MSDNLLQHTYLRKLGSNRIVQMIAAFFLIYTLSGFFILPWAIKRFLVHDWAGSIQHTVQVHDIRFNPYLFKLQVEGLQVIDTDQTPLVSFDQLMLDYEFLSAFRLEFGIEHIALDKPYLKLEPDGKGGYTLLHLFAVGEAAQSTTEPAPKASTSLPAVLLRKLDIRGGIVDYRDAQRAGGFHQILDLPSFSIDDLHTTREGHANRLVVELRDHDAGLVSVDTTVKLQPLQVNGKLTIQNLNLAPVWQWLMLPVNFQLQPPRFDLSTQFDVQMPNALDLQLSAGSVTLRELVLSNKTAPAAPVIRLPLLAVNAVQMNLQKQTVEVGVVQASDGWLDVVMDKQGSINLQALFAPVPAFGDPVAAAAQPARTQSPPTAAQAMPWNVLIHKLAVSNYTVQFRDEQPSENFAATLSPLSITVNEWKPLAADPFTVQIRTGVSDGEMRQPAQIAIDTHVQLTPLMADAHLDVQQMPLSMATPYIHDAVRADIDSGVAHAGLDVHFEAGDTATMSVQGVAKIEKLDVHERGTDRKLLSWDSLDIEAISYQLQSNTLSLGKITLDKLNTGFVINADGTTNVHDLLVARKSPTEKSTAPLSMIIGTVALHDADVGFSDLTMKPNFRVAMQQLSGTIDGLSTDPKTQASIGLAGKVDRYAPVTIKGKLNPLAPKPSLDAHMAFSNLELTTFTPYSGTYAGFKIDKGQLSLDIDYKLVNDKVQGKNRIVVKQLQLGESVKSKKVVDLPLRLAIALLRDEKGVIDLGFEVNGDLSDPKFSVGGIVWKVLSNMIMKVVTSPFKALSGLLGGSADEDIDQIAFTAGTDQIEAGSATRLQKVAALLDRRVGLHLDIQGNMLAEQDRPEKQRQKLLAILRENNTIPADAFLSARAAQDNGDAYKMLARYYRKQRSDEFGDIEDRIRRDMKARGEKVDDNVLQRMVYEQAWQRLQDGIPVTDDELHQLAMQRALRIKDMMVEQYHVSPDRVFVQDANNDPAKASLTIRLVLDAK
ncbi:MAG TPA: DUF748 domain-containing protein [Pseudomonadales bacterium]|nr:DUF748 domain-containing protein [Pseudomonadales bacterium]